MCPDNLHPLRANARPFECPDNPRRNQGQPRKAHRHIQPRLFFKIGAQRFGAGVQRFAGMIELPLDGLGLRRPFANHLGLALFTLIEPFDQIIMAIGLAERQRPPVGALRCRRLRNAVKACIVSVNSRDWRRLKGVNIIAVGLCFNLGCDKIFIAVECESKDDCDKPAGRF